MNNAAITDSGGKTCDELDIATWDRVMNVNVRGTWLITRACRPNLRESGRNAVVNLASNTELWGAPRQLAHVSSKGRRYLNDAFAGPRNGRRQHTVNAIASGPVQVAVTKCAPVARRLARPDARGCDVPPSTRCRTWRASLPDGCVV